MAYNLCCRFKRQKVVEAMATAGAAMDKAKIIAIVEAPPAIEGAPTPHTPWGGAGISDRRRREIIIRELEDRTQARDTPPHG